MLLILFMGICFVDAHYTCHTVIIVNAIVNGIEAFLIIVIFMRLYIRLYEIMRRI